MHKSVIGVLAVAAMIVFSTSTTKASTTELQLSSGTSTVTITDNGAGDINHAAGTIWASQVVNGWIVTLEEAVSNSPSALPVGLQLETLAATCQSAACWNSPLSIDFSSTGFTTAATDFYSTFTLTSQLGQTGSTSQSGWVNTGNGIFGETTLIGTVSGAGTVTGGGAAGPSPYSLTVQDSFSTTGGTFGAANFASFNATGLLGATPEPATMLLFGTGLFMFGAILRRRLLA